MNDKINIGIIGGGGIFRSRHIPGLKKLNNAHLYAVCNRSEKSSKAFASENQVEKTFNSPEELINDPNVHAVMIGTWPYKHCEYVVKALEADKHCFVQARMCMNLKEAKAMLVKSNSKPNLASMICPSPFGFGSDLVIRRLMKEGFVGDVLSVKYTNLNKYNPNSPFNWRNSQEFSGLNIMGMGIFYETISRWVGHAATISAVANINVRKRRDQNDRPLIVDIFDDVLISGRLENNALYGYHFGIATHSPHDKLEIFGTEGTLIFDFEKGLLTGAKSNEVFKVIPTSAQEQKTWQVEEHFIDHILNGVQHETSFAEGLKYMAFTQAVYDSTRSEKVVSIKREYAI